MVKKYLVIPCLGREHIVDPDNADSLFACEVCQTQYEDRNNAEKCEKLPCEEPVFKKGDKVRLTNLDFIKIQGREHREYFSRKRLVGRTGKILRSEYCPKNDQHVCVYFVDFGSASPKHDVIDITFRVPILEKSLEKVIEDKTPQQ